MRSERDVGRQLILPVNIYRFHSPLTPQFISAHRDLAMQRSPWTNGAGVNIASFFGRH
jgi:hypothetical protein